MIKHKMPGYTIITTLYLSNKPMFFGDLSTDGLTENIVYYTDQDVNSDFLCNSIIGQRLTKQTPDNRIVGMCVGIDPPLWLTQQNDNTICYIRRHVYDGINGRVYTILPTLYMTEEEARHVSTECSWKERHNCVNDVVKGYLVYTKLTTF